MWYCKMYFSRDREIFEYDNCGFQGSLADRRELPFLESLLSFLELDLDEYTPVLRKITECWERFFQTGDLQCCTDAMVELGALSNRHIYFKVLYLSWYDYHARMYGRTDWGNEEDWHRIEELRQLPEKLTQVQKQVFCFFELVLDVDTAGREPQAQMAANYFYDQPKDPELFTFHPIPVSFEPVEPGRCFPVLYSGSIGDMIDYSLRSCVEREITVRRCRNCGRYFPQTGRVSAEYCARPVAEGEQVCREIGAFQQWTKKQREEPVFRAYRKEYKRRFAWIKAGRISAEDFYAWSVQARQRKKDCDQGKMTLEEYREWLGNS